MPEVCSQANCAAVPSCCNADASTRSAPVLPIACRRLRHSAKDGLSLVASGEPSAPHAARSAIPSWCSHASPENAGAQPHAYCRNGHTQRPEQRSPLSGHLRRHGQPASDVGSSGAGPSSGRPAVPGTKVPFPFRTVPPLRTVPLELKIHRSTVPPLPVPAVPSSSLVIPAELSVGLIGKSWMSIPPPISMEPGKKRNRARAGRGRDAVEYCFN